MRSQHQQSSKKNVSLRNPDSSKIYYNKTTDSL